MRIAIISAAFLICEHIGHYVIERRDYLIIFAFLLWDLFEESKK